MNYAVSSQWQGGFGADVTLTNLGDPLTAWTLTWSYTAGQTVNITWPAFTGCPAGHALAGYSFTITNATPTTATPTPSDTTFAIVLGATGPATVKYTATCKELTTPTSAPLNIPF